MRGEGVKRKERVGGGRGAGRWVWKMLLNSPSPVASRAAAASTEHTAARPKKREVKSLRSVIKMPLILARPPEPPPAAAAEGKENTSAQKVLTSKDRFFFPCVLVSTRVPGKECGLLRQTPPSHTS